MARRARSSASMAPRPCAARGAQRCAHRRAGPAESVVRLAGAVAFMTVDSKRRACSSPFGNSTRRPKEDRLDRRSRPYYQPGRRRQARRRARRGGTNKGLPVQ
ncbi:Uncharacterised protein [Bordetella pertussis]|nr:Uncharacterised protein [Bordetella pertussis]